MVTKLRDIALNITIHPFHENAMWIDKIQRYKLIMHKVSEVSPIK